jgi:rhodanese-related sulfurtransferase
MQQITRILILAILALAGPALAAGSISVEALAERIANGKAPMIIDVRSEDEYLAGHVPGAQLIPHDQMGSYVEGLSANKDAEIVLYCKSGRRAGMASDVLEAAGFSNLKILDGSFQAWSAAGKPVK